MSQSRDQLVRYRREPDSLTLESLAAAAELHPALVERYVDFGLLEPVEAVGAQLYFDETAILRLRMICRLRRDIGINLSGLGVVLELLDRLCALQRENEWLRSRQ